MRILSAAAIELDFGETLGGVGPLLLYLFLEGFKNAAATAFLNCDFVHLSGMP